MNWSPSPWPSPVKGEGSYSLRNDYHSPYKNINKLSAITAMPLIMP